MKTENTYPEITVSGCKMIDSEGAAIRPAPLTLLYGFNDSGKSSFLEGLRILRNAVSHVSTTDAPFRRNRVSQILNGSFEDVAHKGSDSILVSANGNVSVRILRDEVDITGAAKAESWLGCLSFSDEPCMASGNAQRYIHLFDGFLTGEGGEGAGGRSLMRTLALLDGPAVLFQPESHLHPRWQLGLADALMHASRIGGPIFVETHSEHLILRILRRIRHGAFEPEDLAVYWLEDGKPVQLTIDGEGSFDVPWPHGFFEERGREFFA